MITKTDWTPDDYENVEDFNRQKENIKTVATDILPSLYYFPEHEEISDKTVQSFPYFSVINTLEDNFEGIENCGIFLPDGWLTSRAGIKPDYRDVNRWEQNIKLMHEMTERIKKRWKPSGTFTAGQLNFLPKKVI